MRETTTIKRTAAKVTTPKNRIETPFEQSTKSTGDFYRKVQEKAYELYLQRNGAPGSPEEDWLQAEKIVKGL